MTLRRALTISVSVIGLIVLGSLVLGFVLGQPLLVTYAETESMEPTIAEGDGFLVLPTTITGSPEPGDVVVYDAQEIDGGGLTTHRVVDETEHGYVTKGDANFVTDQDSNEPHVTEGQIHATAVTSGGEVVTIPHLGTAVSSIQSGLETTQFELAGLLGTNRLLGSDGLSTLLLVVGVLTIGLSVYLGRQEGEGRERTRDRTRRNVFDGRRVLAGLAILLCVVTMATMLAMSGTTEFGIVSGEAGAGAPHVITAGETHNETYELGNGGLLPTVTIVEPASDGITTDDEPRRLHRGETANTTVDVTAPPETGYYLRSFAEYRYLGVLPTSVTTWLHGIHPWVALSATTAVIVAGATLPFALLLGTGRIRTRERRRSNATRGFNFL